MFEFTENYCDHFGVGDRSITGLVSLCFIQEVGLLPENN